MPSLAPPAERPTELSNFLPDLSPRAFSYVYVASILARMEKWKTTSPRNVFFSCNMEVDPVRLNFFYARVSYLNVQPHRSLSQRIMISGGSLDAARLDELCRQR